VEVAMVMVREPVHSTPQTAALPPTGHGSRGPEATADDAAGRLPRPLEALDTDILIGYMR
jgi:hypothetical protein